MYIYLLNCSIVLMAAGERCPLGVFASTECSLKKSSISILSLSESFTTFSWTTRSVPAAAISAFDFFPASQNAHDLGSSTGPNCHALTSARRTKQRNQIGSHRQQIRRGRRIQKLTKEKAGLKSIARSSREFRITVVATTEVCIQHRDYSHPEEHRTRKFRTDKLCEEILQHVPHQTVMIICSST